MFLEWFDSALSAVGALCEKIGGAVMKGVLSFAARIPALGLGIETVKLIINVVSAVAEALKAKPEAERPEELGAKAELCWKMEHQGPDDFNSVEEYIAHLRNDIRLDRDVSEMTEEEKRKYAIIAAGLYVRNLEERYEVNMEPEFWRAVLKTEMEPSAMPALFASMREFGINGKQIDGYLAGTLPLGAGIGRQVYQALDSFGKNGGASPEELLKRYEGYQRKGDGLDAE